MKKQWLIAFCGLFPALLPELRAQAIVNPSFESPTGSGYTAPFGGLTGISGWTFGASGGDSYDGYVVNGGGLGTVGIPAGNQAAFIQGTGTFSQAISFTAGTYTLSFYAEARGSGRGPEPLDITIAGAPVTFSASNVFAAASASSFQFVTSDPFTLGAGTWALAFTGTTPYTTADYSTFIDEVSLTAIPEPAGVAMGLALFALGAVGVREHRRRKQAARG